ncbi:MAG TPA: carbohydrate ABC transporter permease [Bacillota bacterium]|nr:carbohydrate ABC transporter permease [Bacillota bacterium]
MNLPAKVDRIKNMGKRPFTARRGWLLAGEAVMLLFSLLFLFPALFTLMSSLKSDTEIRLNPLAWPAALHLNNYVEAWKVTHFPVALFNTLFITVISTAGIVLISSMAAYSLVRSEWKISWFLYLLFTFMMIVPFQTFMVPLITMAKEMSLQNIIGIIPIYLGLGCPMAIFMYHGFIKGVPKDIEESAAIDGASAFRTFFSIVFPLLKPVTATIAILDVLWIWNDFLLPLLILQRGTLQLAQYSFFTMFKQEYALAMASLVLSSAPVIAFYLIMQKYIIKGIAAGAVKG